MPVCCSKLHQFVLVTVALGFGASAAGADEPPPPDSAAGAAPRPPAIAPRPTPKNEPGALSRKTCEAELQKDKHWTGDLANELLSLAGIPRIAQAEEGDYQAPPNVRTQCTAELKRDAQWRNELRKDYLIPKAHSAAREFFRAEVHEEDAKLMLNNKKHVVMGYAALWGLVVALVVLMWVRQRKLNAEIARLESKLTAAIADDK